MRSSVSLEKNLMLGKIETTKRRRWQRMRWLDVITDWMDMSLNKLQVMVTDRVAWRAVAHGVAKSWKQLNGWTTTTSMKMFFCVCWFFMYHFYENCHKPTILYSIILYSIVPYSQFCVLGISANFVGLTNKLDLWMCSWSATCSYVGELLCSTPKTEQHSASLTEIKLQIPAWNYLCPTTPSTER